MSVYCVCIVIVISENIVSALAAQCAGRGGAHSRAANGTSRKFKLTEEQLTGGLVSKVPYNHLSVTVYADKLPNFISTSHVYKPV